MTPRFPKDRWDAAGSRRGDVHIYFDANDMIETDGRFLANSATSAGEKTIRLPHLASVTDALTREVITVGTEARFSLSIGEAKLLWVKQK
ncbi:MAG: hypothetical protein N2512_09200 [Armatimonadetes bacterium]|nr:hypothetical protein [Armatimonadota bacterium]